MANLVELGAPTSGYICMMLLILNFATNEAAERSPVIPTLDTFTGYEDMQHYFNQRLLRSMRHIDNPTDDSYLDAFNLHNEQTVATSDIAQARLKRDIRQLPTIPRMLRFELSDAVTPSMEVKPPQQQQEQLNNKTSTMKDREPRRRLRRSATRRDPDFKVHMIPFEASDAREPDERTAHLIKRGRALETQQAGRSNNSQSRTVHRRKTKRQKRSAVVELVKFELADAKTSLPKSLQYADNPKLPATAPRESRTTDNLITPDETAAESKRLFIYHETPVSIQAKSKKLMNSLPQGVQKVISHLIRNGHEGKAHIKYIPSQKKDYEYLRVKPSTHANVPAKAVEPVQIHIEPVPVVEHLRYVYTPQSQYPTHATTLNQPIIVHEAVPNNPPITEEIHHTYSAESLVVPSAVPQPQFRPSKPDPLHIEPVQSNLIYGRPIEHFKYEIQTEATPTTTPLIKIEYHVPQARINEHYKQLPEFRELSTLIGKSPDDQIHGLTYLLAKEMQAKQRQSKQLLDQPQENTAPIQFHPTDNHVPRSPQPPLKAFTIGDHVSLGTKPGRLIGMAKTKQYVPIVEQGNNDVKELVSLAKPPSPSALPTPSSYIEFTPGHGLSNGYEGVHDDGLLRTVETLVQQHHPKQTVNHGQLLISGPAQLKSESLNGLHYGHNSDKALQQYASKYAFGYRVRDFHTGNDFGHKQNKDVLGVTRGQYHILLPDGRVQNVIYHADDTGFHADVSFESVTTKN